MAAFSSSPLVESFTINQFHSPSLSPSVSPGPSPTKTEVDFPADVDQSFNSSMTFAVDSPPLPSPDDLNSGKFSKAMLPPPPPFALAPPRRPLAKAGAGLKPTASASDAFSTRPFATTRTFGRELSLNARPLATAGIKGKSSMLPSSKQDNSPVRLQWTMSNEDVSSPRVPMPRMGRRESAPHLESPMPKARGAEAMDIDTPASNRIGHSPMSVEESPGLGSFFCESPAAPMLAAAKRKALVGSCSSSPSSSPSASRRSRDGKVASTSTLLFGAGNRRSAPYAKRPPLNPLTSVDGAARAGQANSAYPILCGGAKRSGAPSIRRAFSVCDQQQPGLELSDDESEIEGSPSVQAVNKRHARHARMASVGIRATNGSPCKPMRLSYVESRDKTATRPETQPGGFLSRSEELQGKILPCHLTKGDGLARITPQVMRDVIDGKYSSKMKKYYVFDCRFDYEFEAGHIDGAVHVPNLSAIDELLLSADKGISDGPLPTPARSGEGDTTQQTVLIFHCEFSLCRGPEYAKFLRQSDRNMNTQNFPKVHYPEVYILEGGYCDFFKQFPNQCEPRAYVAMDDPHYQDRCEVEYGRFRKWSRSRSYSGQTAKQASTTRVLAEPLSFAPAGRRFGNAIAEENEPDSSPLARGVLQPAAQIFGSTKIRGFKRTGLQRFASCADAQLAL